jgi:hypothetical protein
MFPARQECCAPKAGGGGKFLKNRKTVILVWEVTLIFLALLLNGIFFGSVAIPLKQALSVFLGLERESAAEILIGVRLPRVMMALLACSMLALGGAVSQAVFRNPLADPYIIGVGSGAVAGASLAFVMGLSDIWFGAFGYIFLDLDAEAGSKKIDSAKAGIPKIDEWDLRCAGTDGYTGNKPGTPAPVAVNRSSILLNTVKGVTAWTAEDQFIEDVRSAEGLFPSTRIDAIGHGVSPIGTKTGYGWYWQDQPSNPTLAVCTKTFVVKTAEGHYAKFQPGTFYGPEEKSGPGFHMKPRYYYVAENKGVFDK